MIEDNESPNESPSFGDQDYDNIRQLQQTKDWLKNQVLEYKSAVLSSKPCNDDEENTSAINDTEKTLVKIQKLQKEIQIESTNHMLKELLLTKLPLGNTAIKVLFPPNEGSENVDTDKVLEESVIDFTELETELVREAMTHHKVIQGIIPNIDKLKKENLDLKCKNRELMANLQILKDEEENHTILMHNNQTLGNAQDAQEKVISKAEVVRRIFQKLIVGSGIYWADDPSLWDLIIGIGKPLEEVLKEES